MFYNKAHIPSLAVGSTYHAVVLTMSSTSGINKRSRLFRMVLRMGLVISSSALKSHAAAMMLHIAKLAPSPRCNSTYMNKILPPALPLSSATSFSSTSVKYD